MKKRIYILLLLSLPVLLAACTAGPNPHQGEPDQSEEIAGFWAGLWHGLIAPITFVISLFAEQVSVFEVHNNGGWYSFGFLLGVSITFGGSGGGAAFNRRRKG